jgi:hypothetical protein
MIFTTTRTHTFYPTSSSYRQTRLLGWLMCAALLLCSMTALFLSIHLWGTYTHTFKPYLKWQDALVYSLWFISFLGVGGVILVVRFLFAAHDGFRNGTLHFIDDTQIAVRDTSFGNLGSIFWVLNASFWCFIAVLVGLVPIILIEWTIRLSPFLLSVVATGVAIVLSLAGLVVSVVSASFIFIGVVGLFSFSNKLGATHIYTMDNKLTIRLDGSILTAIYPDMPEIMLDLNSFEPRDQRFLLSLLHERWENAERSWSLEWDKTSPMVQMAQVNASQRVLV